MISLFGACASAIGMYCVYGRTDKFGVFLYYTNMLFLFLNCFLLGIKFGGLFS